MIADWLNSSGFAAWRPFLTALLLPPVPLLALVLLGAWRARRHRRGGLTVVVVACAALWLSCCEASARWLQASLLRPPQALSLQEREALRAGASAGESSAIVVLGGGAVPDSPEYGASNLTPHSLERLRYGLWLGRATEIPVAMSGGTGWALQGRQAETEADIAARIAATEFGQPLRWLEKSSRDTHENAVNTVALLSAAGVHRIVLVTNGWHMPRALREFRAVAASRTPPLIIEPAPAGLALAPVSPVLDRLPSGDGTSHVRLILREALGALFVR